MDKGLYIKIGVGAALATGAFSAGEHIAFADETTPPPQPTTEQETATTMAPAESNDAAPTTYVAAGGETASGVATRFGVNQEQLEEANPDVDLSSIQTGEVIVVPAATTSEATVPAAEKVVFSSGLTVVNPSGPSDPQSESANLSYDPSQESQVTNVDASAQNSAVAQQAEPTFINLPFQPAQSIEASAVIPSSQGVATANSLQSTLTTPTQLATAASASTPIEIRTNAAAVVQIDSSGISVEITGPASTNTASNTPTYTTPTYTLSSSSEQQGQSQTYSAEVASQPASAEVAAVGDYKQYVEAMQSTPNPQDVLNLQEISVNSNGGILERSKAYDSKMTWLEANTPQYVTPAAYEAFKANGIDTSLSSLNIFEPELPGTKLQSLQCYTMHWTAGITNDPKAGAEAMLNRDVTASVQLMTTQDGIPYLLTETLDTKAYHAGTANSTCVGNEIVGGDLLDFTSQQTLTNILLTVYLHREYGMPLVRDIAQIEAQPRNQYGDYVPLDYTDNLMGPIGHVEVPNSHKLDPTVMYVNFVYEQAVLLNGMLDSESPPVELPGTESPNQLPEDGLPTIDVPNTTTVPTAESNLGGISIASLLAQPVLTLDQEALQYRAAEQGFVAQYNTAPSVTSSGSADTTYNSGATTEEIPANLQSILSESAQRYVVSSVEAAKQNSSNSVLNGGTLSYEQAYGPSLQISDVYIYLREAGATHTEALTLTAIAMRETGLRPASVGDLSAHNGVVMPSYGLFQIRDLGDGNALRDAQSNLDPRKAAQNAYALYKQSGLGPWESDLPTTLSVDALYEAVRLPSRQMDSEQRAAVNQRALSIAEQVLTITTNIRPSVDTAMGVTI